MLTTSHALHGYLLTSIVSDDIVINCIGGLIGASIDIVPQIEVWITKKEKYRPDGLYLKLHRPKGYWRLLSLVPHIAIHQFIDYLTHNDKGWNKWAYIFEVIQIIIIFSLII